MKIVADENIAFLDRFFSDLGEVITLPGREIRRSDLSGADALIVRSVTKVNEDLIKDSSLRFVGTCTIGVDHIDTQFLAEKNISFASAPGSNANSVVEYVLSCLSILTETHNQDWNTLKVGIVGYGNVGSLLAKRLQKLGVSFCVCDPFVDDDNLVSMAEIMQCDVVTLHVPLTREGDHPTFHLFDDERLSSLKPEQVLINTSRGEVVDNKALKSCLDRIGFCAILDVWENEPRVDVELASKVFLGTPHIAGYSFDGKVAGTEMVYRSLCQTLGLPVRHKAAQFLEEPPLSKMAFTSVADADWCIHTAIRACFDVRHDDALLRSAIRQSPDTRAEAFDRFRKNYRCRREFSGVKIQLKQSDPELHKKFRALGFNLK